MLTKLKVPMKGSLQVVFGKVDEQESIIAAKREINEEIRFEVI